MNLLQLINNVEIFIAQWGGTTVPRIIVAFLGILICVWIGVSFWEKRIRIAGTVLGLIAGLFMMIIAMDPRILHILADTDFLTRIRILMIITSIMVLVVTVEAIRRSHLQERYAILWVTTGLIILMAAFFPRILDFFGFLLGTQYVTSVVVIVFTFVLLIAFHFSIALTGIQKKQSQIAQRCAILEAKLEELTKQVAALNPGLKSEEDRKGEGVSFAIPIPPPFQSDEGVGGKTHLIRHYTGLQIASFTIIGISFLAVLSIGIMTPQVMIGDEVTHYYMLADQSKNLSQPNFYANIPTAWKGENIRRYAHSFLWHYFGAAIYRVTGGSFYAVQVYQSLFWLQFLWMAFLLARQQSRRDSYAPVLYLLVLASLPVGLIFSIAFYQDIPMAAQVLTAFYLLRKRCWFWASLFMALAVGLKISALLFLPAFLVLMGFLEFKNGKWHHAVTALVISAIILGSFTWGMGRALDKYAGGGFYPVEQVQTIVAALKDKFGSLKKEQITTVTSHYGKSGDAKPAVSSFKIAQNEGSRAVTAYEAEIIANHPGDLRSPENFFVYGGGILWLVMLAGGIVLIYGRFIKKNVKVDLGSQWIFFPVGAWYISTAAYFLWTAPDARFFLPGLPFILLPFVEGAVRLPRPKVIISIVAAIAILQGGQVLKKTYDLRNVSTGLQEAIAYLHRHPVSPPLIFMYPEGNYRLFPYPHEWYLKYRLREFWKGDNDMRIGMLQQFKIGAVVIKKHLIADVDDAITNLGVYPTYFVRDLEKDWRFKKLFDNAAVIIYQVP